MRGSSVSIGLALALVAAPVAAQDKTPTTYDRAIAAGYKALTLCSGIFNAGRTQAQIEALELTGIYPEYEAIVPTLAATVARKTHTLLVTVPFDPGLPPSAALGVVNKGCTISPIGFKPVLPDPHFAVPPVDRPAKFDAKPWPQGNENIQSSAPSTALSGVLEAAFVADRYGAKMRTTGIVIADNRSILAERYREGFGANVSQRTWSVAKSMTATLIGIAAQQKILDPAAPTAIPEWRNPLPDPRAAITIDQLLRMASGLHSDSAGNRTDAIYFGGTTVAEQAAGLPLEAVPGTRFRYANNDTLLAVHALRRRMTEGEYRRFPEGQLFDRVGMTRTVAETDWQSSFILSSQVWSTARDLARFGLLYLNDGVWNGERILPENWVRYVTTPSGPQPAGEFGYGAGFWLMHKSPGVPADSYAAFGNRGQFVVIVPSRKLVIVRRGEDPAGARFDIAKFTADILASLP